MQVYMSMISPFGLHFTIEDWGYCGGSLVGINQFSALYSLIGTSFGGDGRVSFALPDLRSRSPVGKGSGPGLTPVFLGGFNGREYVHLSAQNLPVHSITLTVTGSTQSTTTSMFVSGDPALAQDPDSNFLGKLSGSTRTYSTTLSTPAGEMGPIEVPSQSIYVQGTTDSVGSGTSVETRSPYQGVNYQICMEGLYPSRS